ncbi:putative NBD/HSP70 family sugar kinase [Nonomuraea thailandensis]|uniref:NBD/HSP70 family sugar kinase n=1 Tax=Nonomuraea thailandensis TaxID=1188745 RepID=A0A9X2GSF0_9ACTN|nr:ROK family transcriptional regulator [Nonomuraea thailandensis]MCP2362927.1 putative NBD/HSP70 family sugar kinase [Nonomuraea thailandensis]
MRARNLAVVLATIHRSGPHTRAALAERTGLTKTTVSSLVADLLEAGVVAEGGAVRGGERGRPGVAVGLSGHRVAALGLEINIDYLAACVVDLTRTVRLRRVRPADNRNSDPAAILEGLRALVKEITAEAEEAGLRVIGAALAVPGTVEGGVLRSAPHLGWRDVRVAGLMDLPGELGHFEMDNEANLAALGELWFGAREPDFLYVSGEIGIGAGLVVRGSLFRGTFGLAGELGHVVVVPDGPACRCGGRGCLEVYAGQDALLGELASVGDLVARLESGDREAEQACERAGHALGVALTSAVHLLDPGRIVLGGIFAPLFRWLEGPVSEGLGARLGQMRGRPPALVVSGTGGEAAVLGAAGLIIQQILAEPAQLLGL